MPAFIVKVLLVGTVSISNSALKSIPSTTFVADPLSNVTKAPTSALWPESVTVTVAEPLDVANGLVKACVSLSGVMS